MANLINVANCGGTTGTFNSGAPVCDVIRDIPLGLILLDAGVELTAADMASATTFAAAIDALTRAPRGGRAYPIWDLTNFEDTSEEATKGAVGNLSNVQIQLVDAIPSFAFQHRKGELFHKQLSRAENQNLKLLIVDKKYAVYGTQTSGGKLTGFSLSEFKAQLPKFGTPAAPSNYPFSVSLSSITEYKENLAFFQGDSTLVNVSGIVDVELSLFNQTTNVAKVLALALGGKNLFDLYATELAAASAWKATNVQTGVAFTITSVAASDTVNKVFTVTLDSTAYAALTAADKVTIELVAAQALETLGVDGYESTAPVTVVKA